MSDIDEMKILVIDDARRNILSAKQFLPGKVVTADSIETAYDILRSEEIFDAVLTDLFLPIGDFDGKGNMDISRGYLSPELPAGLVFVIKAANKGIRAVICTDANHHTDWICALLDLVGIDHPMWLKNRDKEQRIAYIESRCACATLNGYYDEEKDKIILCDYEEYKNKPGVKDWRGAMEGSGLFPELFPKQHR